MQWFLHLFFFDLPGKVQCGKRESKEKPGKLMIAPKMDLTMLTLSSQWSMLHLTAAFVVMQTGLGRLPGEVEQFIVLIFE